VSQWLNSLGVTGIFKQGREGTARILSLAAEQGVKPEEILYMGEDPADIPLMKAVGLPCAPADGAAAVRACAQYISSRKGGAGCILDVITKVLQLQDDVGAGDA